MDRTIHRWLVCISGVSVAVVCAYIGWFFGHLGMGLSDDSGVWGQFGDFLGGFLNPMIAAAALYWLTQSVRIQHRELAETKAELAKTAQAQLEQVRLLRETALLTALGSQINSLNADLASAGDHIALCSAQMKSIAEDEEKQRSNPYFNIEPFDRLRDTVMETMERAVDDSAKFRAQKRCLFDEMTRIRESLLPVREPEEPRDESPSSGLR